MGRRRRRWREPGYIWWVAIVGLLVAAVLLSTWRLALLSLLFGWTKKRSQSLYGSIILHAINNLYSAIFP